MKHPDDPRIIAQGRRLLKEMLPRAKAILRNSKEARPEFNSGLGRSVILSNRKDG